MLAGGERLLALREVEPVWRRQVDDLHHRVGQELFVTVKGPGQVQRGGDLAAFLGRRREDADDRPAQSLQGFNVDRADEPGPDDCGRHLRHAGPPMQGKGLFLQS